MDIDHRAKLENLVQQFSSQNLINFLRAASGSFRPQKEDFNQYLDNVPYIKELIKLGEIDFTDGRRLIALAGQVDTELTSQSGKQKQYEIARKVLKGELYDAGIFAFHDPAGHFRFSLITAQYKGTKRAFSSFRRYTYFVSPESSAHTFVNQIGKADFASIESILEAFSVEPVTKEFYTEYEKIFREAEASITLDWNAEQKRLYTQKFFNRLMFLAFLERKGWMTFNGRRDYLRALFDDYQHNDPDKRREANFHRKRLNTLFFRGLNNPDGQNKLADPQNKMFREMIGNVPYLNGGLFEEEADDIDGPPFPDIIVLNILKDLVYHFNFTVTESTPLDIEVAVDPEMLGKIFEELVTGRHESGSYFTVKPVVAFMCYEALAGYLQSRLPSESEAAIIQFVYQKDPSQLRNPEAVLEALRTVKVCDPACGSGAYLLGMLHVLLELRECLFATRSLDPKTVYERKLEIIQNNLYGVDKDDFAVNIARLRLWLSLIVDYEGDNPPPLPNLDFKIESGDSLTAPDPSGGLDLGFRGQLVDDFLQAKNKYGTPHDKDKFHYREQAYKLRDEIKTWSGRASTFNGFDWVIEFAEIFIAPTPTSTITGAMAGLVNTTPGQMEIAVTPPAAMGFDIILANPPYVRADAQFKHIEIEEERQKQITEWQTYRAQLKNSKICKTLHEKWDLYIPFLERAYQLLRPHGQMIFIIPDAYNAAKYAEKSHDFFLQNSRVMRIDFCSEIDLFDAGVKNTILHFEKGAPPASHQPVRTRRWGKRDEFDDNQENLPTLPQSEFGEALFRFDGKKNEIAEGFVTLDMVCYVSVGMAIHADEKKVQGLFKAEDLVSEFKDKQHPKSYVEGKDIAKWGLKRTRYLEYGTERAPSMFRRPTFIELHEPPEKLMAFRMCGENIAVTYDNQQYMSNHTVILCVPWHLLKGVTNKSIKKAAEYKHQNPEGNRENREKLSQEYHLKYILAVMNSTFAKQFLNKIRQSKIDIYPDEWKQLPIAPLPLEAQQPFVEKVDTIL
ncbi:hypothetical protein D4S03_02525, partial [bacterium]